MTFHLPTGRGPVTDLAGQVGSLGLASGPANVIMQLAWPEVGWGVRESRVDTGNVYKRPFKRARTTFQYLAVATIGDDDDKRRYREAVDRVHRLVHSTPASRVKYSAMDPKLQMWVAACLYIGFEDVFEWLHGPMTDSDRRRPVAEHLVGTTEREFRDELGLPWNPRDQRRFETFLAVTAGLNGLLPESVRTLTYRLLLVELRWRLRTGRPLV